MAFLAIYVGNATQSCCFVKRHDGAPSNLFPRCSASWKRAYPGCSKAQQVMEIKDKTVMPAVKNHNLSGNLYAGKIFFALLGLYPIMVAWWFPETIGNRFGDPDVWFYFGHFDMLGTYSDYKAGIAHNYYQTRLAFTIPGYAIFSLFPVYWAKIAFAYLIYAICISCFVYVLRYFLPKIVVLLAAIFLVSDIFFVRTFGWNYVDSGILAYQALVYASLTAAAKHPSQKFLWVFLAAFCFASMISIHLGSAVLIIPMLGYAWLVLRFDQLSLRAFFRLLGVSLIGVLVCQFIYGILNILIWNSRFFFILEQVSVSQVELSSLPQWKAMGQLFRDGDWLAIHLAVWIASLVALIAGAFKLIKLNRFYIYCFSSVVVTYLLLFTLDYNRLGFFLSRQGLYVSFLLLITYMAVACLISRMNLAGIGIAAGLATVSIILRLSYSSGGAISFLPIIETWMLGLSAGAMLCLAYIFPRKGVGVAALCLFAFMTIFVKWQFVRTDGIYETRAIIKKVANGDLPYIAYATDEPPYWLGFISSIVASFTERAWVLRSYEFPNLPNLSVERPEKLFVLSANIDANAARAVIEPQVDSLIPISSDRVQLPQGELFISGFEVVRKVNLSNRQFAEWQRFRRPIPAAALPSRVGRIEGDARVAVAPETPAGSLTFGPYAQIAPGEYDVTIQYGPSDGAQKWDIMLRDADGERVIAKGAFEPTSSGNAQVNIPLTLKNAADRFQVRSIFTGQGRLTVKSIDIKARSDR